MHTLAVERSTAQASFAIYRDDTCLLAGVAGGLQPRAPEWVRTVADGLSEVGIGPADLDRLVAGTGPGSFSGVRAAIAVLQGLALPRELPLLGISSAAAMARRAALCAGGGEIVVVGDARRNRLWCAIYEVTATGRVRLAVSPPKAPTHTGADFALVTWEELPGLISAAARVVSPDWARLAPHASVACPTLTASDVAPTAVDVVELLLADPDAARPDPVPIYLHPAVG